MNLSLAGLVEHYQDRKLKDFGPDPNTPSPLTDSDKKYIGMTFGIFMVILVVAFILWIVALVLLVQNWKKLPDWAKILGFLGVIPVVPFGSIVTIIAVLCGRQM